MGLFADVLHIRDQTRSSVIPALEQALRVSGFRLAQALPVPSMGPSTIPDFDQATRSGHSYLMSALQGRWLTIIDVNGYVEGHPAPVEVAHALSGVLACTTLVLTVHDDDVSLYNLDHAGRSVDGYNSWPQYFEDDGLTDAEIAAQRHHPAHLEGLLPPGRSPAELRAILDRGWWRALEHGHLDEDGCVLEEYEEDNYPGESDRMTELGTLLQLHGKSDTYPYLPWRASGAIHLPDFPWLKFARA